jgi:hypothetical protein
MPQAGLLVQLDGSRHDWLEGRGPRLSLVGAIDDATGVVTGATFREQEDALGYLMVLRETVRRHGIPLAVYRDRHTIFETPATALTLEEQLVDRRTPTQLGRALEELGINSIAARTPQAKGRIERLWGTFRDRLVSELRLAGAADREAAEVVPRLDSVSFAEIHRASSERFMSDLSQHPSVRAPACVCASDARETSRSETRSFRWDLSVLRDELRSTSPTPTPRPLVARARPCRGARRRATIVAELPNAAAQSRLHVARPGVRRGPLGQGPQETGTSGLEERLWSDTRETELAGRGSRRFAIPSA